MAGKAYVELTRYDKEKMVKIYIQDILFAEADRNYCRIYTPGKENLLATPLKSL